MRTLELIKDPFHTPDNLKEIMEMLPDEINKMPFLEYITKVFVAFEDAGLRKSVTKIYDKEKYSRIKVELYPMLNNLGLYFARRRVREHFSLFLENVADYTRFYIEVPYYILDFKALAEEEKIYCIESIDKGYKFILTKEEHQLSNKFWIKENDYMFYEKYRLLFE